MENYIKWHTHLDGSLVTNIPLVVSTNEYDLWSGFAINSLQHYLLSCQYNGETITRGKLRQEDLV